MNLNRIFGCLLPGTRLVVFQEQPIGVLGLIDPDKDWVEYAGRSIDLIQRRTEASLAVVVLGLEGVLIVYPAVESDDEAA